MSVLVKIEVLQSLESSFPDKDKEGNKTGKFVEYKQIQGLQC